MYTQPTLLCGVLQNYMYTQTREVLPFQRAPYIWAPGICNGRTREHKTLLKHPYRLERLLQNFWPLQPV